MSNDILSRKTRRLASWTSGRRIAFEVRYAAAILLDRGLPNATDHSLAFLEKAILAPILAKADELRVSDSPELDLLRQHLSELRAKQLNQRDTSEVIIEIRVHSFCNLVEKALACLDQRLPADLSLLFQRIEGAVIEHYTRHCPNAFIEPVTRLELNHMDADCPPGAAPISGSCRVDDDDGATPVSVVTLSVRDDRLNRSAICRLPYVLMHELLCHAYQSISQDDRQQPREDVDNNSAWTEGWMDSLAVIATEALIHST